MREEGRGGRQGRLIRRQEHREADKQRKTDRQTGEEDMEGRQAEETRASNGGRRGSLRTSQ